MLPIHPSYRESLVEVHWAAQIVAAASGLLVAKADFSHNNLFVDDNRLKIRPIAGRYVGLTPATLTIHVDDEVLSLVGRTVDDGLTWMREQLGEHVDRLQHDLPARPLDAPFRLFGAEAQLHAWFQHAQRVLTTSALRVGGGEVRLWPHHFDMATLLEIDQGAAVDEQARSLNIGLSPGDGTFDGPYWYVTPWPTPQGELPVLSSGSWHRKGFTAAVLPASSMMADEPDAQAERFINEAVAVCRQLLE